MIKLAICDDELHTRNQILNIIENYIEKRKIKVEICLYSSGESLLNDLNEGKVFSCLFLDIDLNESINGLEVASKIRETYQNKMFIVFVTSFTEYQSQVFSLHTFDYVTKPFKNNSITKILDDFFFWYNEQENTELIKLSFKTIDGIISINKDDIIYFEYFNRRINIITKDGMYHMYGKMKDIAKKLRNYDFVMPHASYIVNINEIKIFSKPNYSITMTDNNKIPISQLKIKSFNDDYMNFLRDKGLKYYG